MIRSLVTAQKASNFIVVAEKMEVEQAIERLEDQTLIQAGSTFIQAAAKTSNSKAGMLVGTAPCLPCRLDSRADTNALAF